MSRVHVHNPHPVPVQVPGYGLLAAGGEASVVQSPRLRRAIQHGRVITGPPAKDGAKAAGAASTEDAGAKSDESARKAAKSGSRRRESTAARASTRTN